VHDFAVKDCKCQDRYIVCSVHLSAFSSARDINILVFFEDFSFALSGLCVHGCCVLLGFRCGPVYVQLRFEGFLCV
jgi:hypothetical protein